MLFTTDEKHKQALYITTGILILMLVFIILNVWSAKKDTGSQSLTPAAAYFNNQIEQTTTKEIGAQPVEGFEPYMIMDAFEGLMIQDFEGAEAMGGSYTVQKGELIFKQNSQLPVTSASQALTEWGIAQILVNLSQRMGLPIQTTEDIDKILNRIDLEDTQVMPVLETLRGSYECLPHKAGGEFQTLECALGIKTDDGLHYALDTQMMTGADFTSLSVGTRLEVTGMVTPIEMLSTDFWRRYEVKGIMTVRSWRKL